MAALFVFKITFRQLFFYSDFKLGQHPHTLLFLTFSVSCAIIKGPEKGAVVQSWAFCRVRAKQ